MPEVLGGLLITIVLVSVAIVGIVAVAIAVTIVYSLWVPTSYIWAIILALNPNVLARQVPGDLGQDTPADAKVRAPEEAPGARRKILRKEIEIKRWSGRHDDRDVALPSYYFGPAAEDIVYVAKTFGRNCQVSFSQGANTATRMRAEGPPLVSIVIFVGMSIGLAAGGLIGSIGAAIICVAHITVAAVTTMLALVTCALLRTADALRRLVAGIRMTCLGCGDRVWPYPSYRCPGCNELHRDIRPGSHGIARRICICQARLPTSMLFGAGRLAAVCPKCGVALPGRFGIAADIAIPFFGAANVGKTRLMYALTFALRRLVTDSGGVADLIGDASERLDRIADALVRGGNTSRTIPESPRGYGVHIKIGLHQRLIYLFDAAGELHLREEGLADMKYLDQARVFVFVADPLAADGLWGQLSEDRKKELTGMRSRATDVDESYQRTREQMRSLGAESKFSSMAFVVSKADLLRDSDRSLRQTSQSIRDWVQDGGGLDMGDTVREAVQSFRSVEFFHTAALVDDSGIADDSVEELVQWILRSEGIRLGWQH